MPLYTPITWVAGSYPTAAQFNEQIRDNISFLQNPPACRVYNSVNQALTSGVNNTLLFNSERFDTDNMHSTASLTERITINTAGLYVVGATLKIAGSTAGTYRELLLRVNGSNFIVEDLKPATAGAGHSRMIVSTSWKFAAGDYVEAIGTHDAGVALNSESAGSMYPEFWAVWVGRG